MAEKINVTFLGTGSAVPTKQKNHASYLISFKDQNLLFDCGEGTQRQIRLANLNPCKITKIFITHWHGDHTLGIPGLLQTLSLNSYNGVLEIHGPVGTKRNMKFILEFYMKTYFKISKEQKNNFEIKVYEHKNEKVVETNDFIVNSFLLDHGINAIGFSFIVKEKRRIDKKKLSKLKIPNSKNIKNLTLGKDIIVDGKKIKSKDITYLEESRKISYVSDTKITKSLPKDVKDSNLLIIESTYSEEKKDLAEKYCHLTAKQAGTIAKKGKVKNLALVHLSQQYELEKKLILSEAKSSFNGEVFIAKDFDKMTL